jgi:hypothetical protein
MVPSKKTSEFMDENPQFIFARKKNKNRPTGAWQPLKSSGFIYSKYDDQPLENC